MLQVASDLEDYVRQKIESGEFASREELANEAIRAYREMETQYQQLRADVQRSIEQADRGEIEPFDIEAVKVRLTAELDPRGRPRSCRE